MVRCFGVRWNVTRWFVLSFSHLFYPLSAWVAAISAYSLLSCSFFLPGFWFCVLFFLSVCLSIFVSFRFYSLLNSSFFIWTFPFAFLFKRSSSHFYSLLFYSHYRFIFQNQFDEHKTTTWRVVRCAPHSIPFHSTVIDRNNFVVAHFQVI